MPTDIEKLLKYNLDTLEIQQGIELIKSCGKLASRILRSEVYDLTRLPRPSAAFWDQIGVCEVLVTIPSHGNSVLRDSAIIPFRWENVKENTLSLPQLPKGLQAVVDSVKQEITRYAPPCFSNEIMDEISHLKLVPESDDVRFDGCWDSAWASLAAGMMQKLENIGAQCNVFITGSYKNQIISVGEIAKKIAIAKEFGAKKVFVPESNSDEAHNFLDQEKSHAPEQWCDFEIHILKNEADPFLALKDFRLQSRQKPVGFQNHGFEDFQKYYLKTNSDNRDSGRQYFIEELVPALLYYKPDQVTKWRKIIFRDFIQPITYLTVMSDANEVTHLVRQLLPEEDHKLRLVIACWGTKFVEEAKKIGCNFEITWTASIWSRH